MFTLNTAVLQRLLEVNCFAQPSDKLLFFGLRGCLPLNEDNYAFQEEHPATLAEVDYTHPRCTLIQWDQEENKIAIFPGSTVPHKRYVAASLIKNGEGANQLITGMYKDYRKGWHKAGRPTSHNAFRQDNRLPVRRTGDDMDYDEEDRVEFVRPYDNIHAAWCPGINYDRYESAGCQVIVGYPECAQRNNSPSTGAWKHFSGNAYAIDQDSFHYVLLNGRDAQKIALDPKFKFSMRLRYGSSGSLVKEVQQKLKEHNYYEGRIDGDFGSRTLFAVLNFQTTFFGADADDGIVGPMTAEALQLNWPTT